MRMATTPLLLIMMMRMTITDDADYCNDDAATSDGDE
jgi:hypothetical protein